jgi:hypothetical protein
MTKLIEERNELLRLAKAAIKEHKFRGYPIAGSESIKNLEKYVEKIYENTEGI